MAPPFLGQTPSHDELINFENGFDALCPATLTSASQPWRDAVATLIDTLSRVQTTQGWRPPSHRAISAALDILAIKRGKIADALLREGVSILRGKSADAQPFLEKALSCIRPQATPAEAAFVDLLPEEAAAWHG
ncbi:MAG TPA: hypothetical protein VLJ86_12960 [Ramlibacter sp.]|nr:hypothetical protein [Ramlibacter sp.]